MQSLCRTTMGQIEQSPYEIPQRNIRRIHTKNRVRVSAHNLQHAASIHPASCEGQEFQNDVDHDNTGDKTRHHIQKNEPTPIGAADSKSTTTSVTH